MNDLEVVGMPETVAHLNQERDPVGYRKGASPSLVLAERFPLEKRHNQVDQSVWRFTQPQNRADVRMIQTSSDGGFAPQSLDRGRIAGQTGDENLDRHGSSAIDLLRLVDIRHPTFAQLAGDVISLIENLAGE
jgi:hypothetical protein